MDFFLKMEFLEKVYFLLVNEEMGKGFSEDVPDAHPDYQPAYDTSEKPWPWNISDNNISEQLAEQEEPTSGTDKPTEDSKKEPKKREIISNCGSIDIGLEYNPANRRITVTILECNELPNQDRGVAPIIQVFKSLIKIRD